MIEPVTREEMDAACVRLCRRVAASVIRAMADTNTSYAEIDARLQRHSGWAKRMVNRLIEGGRKVGLRDVSDLFLAMDCEIEFSVERVRPAPPSSTTQTEER